MNHQRWSRFAALAICAAMAGGLPSIANADTVDQSEQQHTQQMSGVAAGILHSNGNVNAFIETDGVSGVEQKVQTLDKLNMQRSGKSEGQKETEANQAGIDSATAAEQTTSKVVSSLKKIDANAKVAYTTSYASTGVVVNADAQALRKLAEQSDSVLRIVPLTLHTPLTASTGDVTASENAKAEQDKAAAQAAAGSEVPANKNSDQLVNAIKTWTNTGNTGKGVNVAVVDTGLDYTHADFGGAGTQEAYQTALASTADPLNDPTLSSLLDGAKYKGGYDFAGPVYGTDTSGDGTPDYDNAEADANPIDGEGGHHGTHVSGSVAGLGVTAEGKTFDGDYTKLSNGEVAGMKVGPGSAPDAGLYALKVFGDAGGSTDLVLQALDWVSEHNLNAKNDADKIGVVSMSLGGSFGQSDDPENVAVDNLAQDGVLSVIAAGNEGDVTDIMGAPGTAHSALTVAASQSGKTLQDAVEVTAGPDSVKGQKFAGQYSQNFSELSDFSVEGEVARVKDADNLEGCKAYSDEDAAAVKGKIAYIHWDDANVVCGSGVRFNNAQNAGAIGIIFDSQLNIPEAGIGGNASLPGFQIVKKNSDDINLEQIIDDGGFKVRLGSDLRLSLDADYATENEDTIASFTSRGIHGSYDGTVKPDVAAPGVGIISASAGSGSEPEVMSGTSMATPLTSGVVALVRSAHPKWNATTVKQQMINTANHDVLSSDRSTAYGPLRVGTGRIDALAAVKNAVQVSSDDPVAVTAQFGIVQVPENGYSATKTITVTNTSDKERSYAVAYKPRAETPGVTYTTSVNAITVPAGGTADFDVTLNIPDQSALLHTRDITQAEAVVDRATSYVTDATGVVELNPNDSSDGNYALRVAVASAPRPVSATDASYLKSVDGNQKLTIAGHGVNQGEDAQAYMSQSIPMVLSTEDPVDAYGVDADPDELAVRDLQAADIRAIGYSSSAPQLTDPSQGMLNFGIVTDKTWNRLGNSYMPDVVLDADDDGMPDHMITVATSVGATQYDTAWAQTRTIDATGHRGSVVDEQPIDDAFISDSNQVVLSVKLSALGLTKDSPSAPMNYYVQTESVAAAGNSENAYIADIAGGDDTTAFDAYAPALWFGQKSDEVAAGTSVFDDQQDTTMPVNPAATKAAEDVKTLTLHTLGSVPDAADDKLVIDIDTLSDEPQPVDKTALQAAVDAAGKLNESDYTTDSWKAFSDALSQAQQVLADGNATQDQVDAAAKALKDAQNALVKADGGTTENPAPGTPTPDTGKDSGKPAQAGSLSTTGSAVAIVAALAVVALGIGAGLTVIRRKTRS